MITVLRLGHRAGRDPRISTHCALVARAFGATSLIYTGEHDIGLEKSVRSIVQNWGGPFVIEHESSWRSLIKDFPGKSVHLTMYGLPIQEKIREIRKSKDILVIIGGQKVPADVYGMSDFNIGVTSQPHSEVAALAVFLHELQLGKELEKTFENRAIGIIPQRSGKRTVKYK